MVIKKILSVILLISVLFLWGADSALAAAIATHSFDECTAAVDIADITLGCKDGGTGWATSWVNGTAGYVGRSSNCQVANCIVHDAAGDNLVHRTFAATASGHGSVYTRRTSGDTNSFRMNVCADGTTTCSGAGKFYIRVDRPTAGGDVNICGSTCETLGSWTADTQQISEYQWGTDSFYDTACSAGQVKMRFNGGAFSSCLSMNAGNNPGTIEFESDDVTGGDTMIWDELNNAEPVAAAGGATVPGVPLHSRFMFF